MTPCARIALRPHATIAQSPDSAAIFREDARFSVCAADAPSVASCCSAAGKPMSAGDITISKPHAAAIEEPSETLRAIFAITCVVVPVTIWLVPFDIPHAAKGAMAISAFMILAWMTNIMEYGAAGLIGCLLFWALGVANRETSFAGFVNNDTPWFLFGAILLGVAATKTGVPQRVGAFVVTRVG